jgi:peptidoglycan/LPS O-acetylase OafA/YrhL
VSQSSSQSNRIEALTGLRFFAALHIVLFHQATWIFENWANGASGSTSILADGALEFIRNGPASVSFFFILSGFILFHTYYSAIEAGTLSKRRFWVARFARVFPVYLLGLVLMMPLMLVACRSGVTSIFDAARSGVLSLFLLQSWHVPDALSWNAPGWSLSVEAFFYLSFPFIAPRFAGMSVRTAVCSALVLHVLTRLVFAGLEGQQKWMDFSAYFPPCRLGEFVLGLAVGRVFVATRKLPVRMSKSVSIALLLGSAFLLVGIARPLGVTGGLLLQPLAFAVAIYSVARTGAGGVVLGGRLAILLGEASYAMYLLHVPVARYLGVIFRRTIESGAFGVVGLIGYVVLVIAISIVAFRWFELPARNWLRKRL